MTSAHPVRASVPTSRYLLSLDGLSLLMAIAVDLECKKPEEHFPTGVLKYYFADRADAEACAQAVLHRYAEEKLRAEVITLPAGFLTPCNKRAACELKITRL